MATKEILIGILIKSDAPNDELQNFVGGYISSASFHETLKRVLEKATDEPVEVRGFKIRVTDRKSR